MSLIYTDLVLSPYETEKAIAVGVSGGPDSMALAWLLKEWGQGRNIPLHILSVDHGLRPQSAAEARQVGDIVGTWPDVYHRVLEWCSEKPESRLLEEARRARYGLMAEYCREHQITYLFLAHHQDDQAETFLFRLAKGSGLDGLSGMQRRQRYNDSLTLVRPLLGFSKQALIDVCEQQGLAYIHDPTNDNPDYARPRLRAARAVLEEEGLSAKRLAVTAARLARARSALEHVTGEYYRRVLTSDKGATCTLDWQTMRGMPEDIIIRILLKAIAQVSALERDYPARLERIEQLVLDFLLARERLKVTLAGCVFELNPQKGVLCVERETL